MHITHERSKLAPLLILLLWLYPVVYFIKFNQLHFWQSDLSLLWISVISIVLISAALVYWSNWIVRIIIIALTTAVTLSFIPSLFSNLIWVKVAAFLVLIGLLWVTDKTIIVLTTVIAAMLLSSIFLPVGQQLVGDRDQINQSAPKPNRAPLIIHIVLDEHISPDGIPANVPQGPAMKQFLQDFYLRHGFTLYTHAYSRYPRTYDSIPNLLNFTEANVHTEYFPGGIHKLTLDKAAAFQMAQAKGYQIRVFQAYYINYCRVKDITLGRCYTYATRDLSQIQHMPISAWAKNNFMFKSFLLNSSAYLGWIDWYSNELQPAANRIGIKLPLWPWANNQLSSPSAMTVFGPLEKDIEQHPKGVFIFAHILLPHSPYVFNNTCQIVKNPDNWYTNYDEGPVGNAPDRRRLRYHYYLQQMHCLYQPLDQMLNKLDQEGLLSNAYIVIHGDHGSRIAEHGAVMGNEPNITWQDFNDSYAALFAMRTPHSKPAVIDTPLPIAYLYARWFSEAIGTPMPVESLEPYVYLTVRDTSLRIPMTKFPLKNIKDAPVNIVNNPYLATNHSI